jgi:hypothetical protein
MGFQGTMPLFLFVFFHWVPQKNKDFFGLGYCMGEHPETSVFPVWVPSLCCYPGAIILGMALSLGIYPKLIGASQT